MSVCVCMPRRMRCLKPAGNGSGKTPSSTATRTFLPPLFPSPRSYHLLQLPLPPVLRQDRSNGRQRGRVQLELLDGCAECAGVEGGWGNVEAVGDAAYVDVMCACGRYVIIMISSGDALGGLTSASAFEVMLRWYSSASNQNAPFLCLSDV